MKKLLMAAMALAVSGGAAFAGSNAGGTLIIHANTTIVYTVDDEALYCAAGIGGGPGTIGACEDAVNSVPGESAPVVYAVLGAFLPSNNHRLKAVTFGVSYTANVVVAGYGSCGGFELSDAGWPGSGLGTGITFDDVCTTPLCAIYWFAGYTYTPPGQTVEPGLFCVGPHPTQGGKWADDSVPAIQDLIAGYGCLGFGQAGSTPCPQETIPDGFCCLPNFGGCQVMSADACAALGGVAGPPGSTCDPDPCPPPPVNGACCVGTTCIFDTEEHCLGAGGVYQGDNIPCDPDPCQPPVATVPTTWGAIKANHR